MSTAASVGPDDPASPAGRGVLFVDVCGSVRLYERLGNDAAMQRIGVQLALLSAVVTEFSGRVVKTIGDELMCLFPDAGHCARASIEMLERLRATAQGEPEPIRFKIGMHCGEVIDKDEDIFGDAVNLAARMVSLANQDQLILTDRMRDQLPAELQQQCRSLGPIYVKGKQQPVVVFELLWDTSDPNPATVIGPSMDIHTVITRKLELRFGGQVCQVDSAHPSATIGRSADSDLVDPGALASRHHLVVEMRGEQFIVTDKSTNASYIGSAMDLDGQRLHRGQMILADRGWISLGLANPGDDQKIHFQIL